MSPEELSKDARKTLIVAQGQLRDEKAQTAAADKKTGARELAADIKRRAKNWKSKK
jgi:hypothetical protein